MTLEEIAMLFCSAGLTLVAFTGWRFFRASDQMMKALLRVQLGLLNDLVRRTAGEPDANEAYRAMRSDVYRMLEGKRLPKRSEDHWRLG